MAEGKQSCLLGQVCTLRRLRIMRSTEGQGLTGP